MDNLLFYTLLIAITYYALVYLPSQKSHSRPVPLTSTENLRTEPIQFPSNQTINCPGPEDTPDPEFIKKLEDEVSAKQAQIQALKKDYKHLESKKDKEISDLQTQIRDLAKRPLKPTHSKSTQTDELTQTLDNLIKDIQNLNNSL